MTFSTHPTLPGSNAFTNLSKTLVTKASEYLYTVNPAEDDRNLCLSSSMIFSGESEGPWNQLLVHWSFKTWLSKEKTSCDVTKCKKNLLNSADASEIGFDVARHWTWYTQALGSYSDFHHPNPIILRWSQHTVYPVCEIFVNHQRIIWMTIPSHHHGGPAPGIRGSGSVLGSGRVFPSA